MSRYGSGMVLAIIGLGASCGGKTSSTSTGSDPEVKAGAGPVDPAASSGTTACSAIAIDDMEKKDGAPPPIPGGGDFWWSMGLGNWFYDLGKDAPAEYIVPPRGDSKRARHVEGNLGNGLLCQLNHPSGAPVDLSAFKGVTFWARVARPGGRLVVSIKGKENTAAGVEPFAQEAVVSDTWRAIDLSFADFHQATSGRQFGVNAIADFDFKIVGVEAFDLWIDDFALVCPSLH